MTETLAVRLPGASTYRPVVLTFPATKYDRNAFLQNGMQTGHAIWPCSRLLCDYLMENPSTVEGKRVLELGCGLGVCGSVAALMGASEVLFTDGDDAVLDKARAAAEVNFPLNERTLKLNFQMLRWGPDYPYTLPLRYDIVIGSDLLYGPPSVPVRVGEADPRIRYLLSFVSDCMDTNSECAFYLSFERRDVSYDEICDVARELKLDCVVPEGEYFEDIFGNRTEEMTDFWRACLFKFTRRL